MFTKIVFEDFTAFSKLEVDFSPGINILIGENGTGKTHIIKALYASADITTSKVTRNLADKINRVFLPSEGGIGRLVHRKKGRKKGFVEIHRVSDGHSMHLRLTLSNMMKKPESAVISGTPKRWLNNPIESVYIPVKEMLSNAPGFRSEYENKKLAFEEIYPDIIGRALRAITRGPAESDRKRISEILKKAIDGKVFTKGEEFFLSNKSGNLEFTLLAEGFRKLGLLWVLIQNGTLLNGAVLFWDEPETNLNPKLIKCVIEILIELQRIGVQIFITTHNYVVLKWFDLLRKESDHIRYHSLYRDPDFNIVANSTDAYSDITPNPIDDAFEDIIGQEIINEMGDLGK